MRPRTLLVAGAAALGALLAAQIVRRYQRERRLQAAQLRAQSEVVDTACGRMEYASVGDGPRLLFAHGAMGGYDHSLLVARLIRGFQVIAPSRPGHLRTPLATGRTPAEQADAYAALLDALHIPQIAMIGGSGGGPSALQFALRHPDRCWALVMVCAVCLPPPASIMRRYRFWAALMRSDFLMWAFTHLTFDTLLAFDSIAPAVRARLERDDGVMDIVRGLLLIHLSESRRAGLVNDLAQAKTALPICGLERLTQPTLIIHGAADLIAPFPNAEYLARAIPGATLLAVEGAGHLCIATHREITIPPLEEFLRRHAP